MALIKCPECGREISDLAPTCPHCGVPISDKKETYDPVAENDSSEEIKKPKLPQKRIAVAVAIAAVCIIAVAITLLIVHERQKPTDLSAVYDAVLDDALAAEEESTNEEIFTFLFGVWCTLSDDGKSLSIDTNPANMKSGEYSDEFGLSLIRSANTALELPDALTDKMLQTRAIDGMQSAEYRDVKITWSFHPDQGLEVIYEVVE